MSYSQFTLESLKTTFGITIVETAGIFANVPEAILRTKLGGYGPVGKPVLVVGREI